MAALTNRDGLFPDMSAPVRRGELVADQRVTGRGVGNAQKRLGEAHQRHAFLTGQGILIHQPLDAARARLCAQACHQGARERVDPLRLGGRQFGEREEGRHALRLGRAGGEGNRGAQRRLRDDLGAERGEGVGDMTMGLGGRGRGSIARRLIVRPLRPRAQPVGRKGGRERGSLSRAKARPAPRPCGE